ncbi:MAG: hypothetical protein ACYSSO_10130 [Planctomycetota bacterium]|jgi:hypothetical protein
MNEKEYEQKLIKRLNTIVVLLVEGVLGGESVSTANKIRRLLDTGLSPAEVGEILGKPTNYITASMSKKKKIRKRS